MNKTELIAYVAEQSGLTKTDSEKAVNAVFTGITSTLKSGQDATFIGFGTFGVTSRAARTGRNPRTGATLQIAASKQPKFKAGKNLKDAING